MQNVDPSVLKRTHSSIMLTEPVNGVVRVATITTSALNPKVGLTTYHPIGLYHSSIDPNTNEPFLKGDVNIGQENHVLINNLQPYLIANGKRVPPVHKDNLNLLNKEMGG